MCSANTSLSAIVPLQESDAVSFASLGLSEKVLRAVLASGFEIPTPVQREAIPAVLARRDVLALAQTGSGKTAAFALPMLSLLEKGRPRARMPRTLVLEPTRELALQVHEAFEKFGRDHALTIALLIGGVSFEEQSVRLDRGADVVIATPGRLLDHLERGKLLPLGMDVFVVDEADRMLDMGFIPDVEKICKALPTTRQTLFFSATMSPEIERLASQFLKEPVRIEVAPPSTTASTIIQRAVRISSSQDHEKRKVLRKLLETYDNIKNSIVFANRKSTVDLLERSCRRHGFDVLALHGDMDQHARLQALGRFRSGEVKHLIASDVAARGLDIPQVSHVFNFDVPVNAEDYVHRIGRTGRAGREGHSFTLVAPEDGKHFSAIETLIQQKIEWHTVDVSSFLQEEDVAFEKPRRRSKTREKEGVSRVNAKKTPFDKKNVDEQAREKQQDKDSVKKNKKIDEGEPIGFTAETTPAFLLRPFKAKP